MGIPYNAARQLLSGNVKTIKLDTLYYLCHALGCTPNDLLDIPPPAAQTLPPAHPLQQLVKAPLANHPLDIVGSMDINQLDIATIVLKKIKEGKVVKFEE